MKPPDTERSILFLIGAIQFVNILEFMIVMPLGPDFARDLGMAVSDVGWVGGAYTAAAAVSGVACGFFLDRFDRRTALAVALLGLVLGTAAGGLAQGPGSLMAARVVAGLFGGPATALSLSVVADVVPPERRGRAMGAVMGAFAVASVIGVPAGLELARLFSWRAPFFAVAGLGVVIAILALARLPALRGHLSAPRPPPGGPALGRDPAALASLAAYASVTIAAFSIIPNISAHMQASYGVPRDRLGLLYLAGGALSFFALRVTGRLVDRFGATRVAAAGTVFFIADLYAGFVRAPFLPGLAVFCGFMLGMSFRNVPMSSLSSRVPLPHQRARFLSAQSAVQHMASSVGAVLATRILRDGPGGTLLGFDRVAWISIGFAAVLPLLLRVVESGVRRRERDRIAVSSPPLLPPS